MGLSKFQADPDILDAWQRLIAGDFVQSDLQLLLHEYSEALIMNGTKISYDKCHPLINNIYNWENSF